MRCLRCGSEHVDVVSWVNDNKNFIYHSCSRCPWIMNKEDYDKMVCEALEEALEESC